MNVVPYQSNMHIKSSNHYFPFQSISEEKLSVVYLEMKGMNEMKGNHLMDELEYKYCHREAVRLHCTVYVV